MNSWEYSRRDEQRESFRRRGGIGAVAFVAVCIFAVGVFTGRHFPAAPTGDGRDSTQLALDQNADSLRIVRAHADSVAGADAALASADSVAQRVADAATIMDSIASGEAEAHRPAVIAAGARIEVTDDSTDGTIIVSDSAQQSDTLLSLPVASFIRAARIQMSLDASALRAKDLRIASLDSSLAVKDQRIATKDDRIAALEEESRLHRQRDSLHVQKEGQLAADRDAAYRRGVKTGAKVVLGAAAIVRGAIKIVQFFK